MINIRHIKEMKGKEVFWYEDMTSYKFIIGIRGVGEFKIDRWDMVRAEDSFRLREGRHWNEQEALKWAIDYARKESEYIDFEDVSPNILRLGIENTGAETNQTK